MWLKNFNQSGSNIIIRQPSLSASVVAMIMIFPSVSQATNGYFAHGYGVRSKAMAGVGAALPQDAMAAAVNPAGMVFVGNRLDLEVEVFSPRREYSVSGTPTMAAGAFPLNNGTVDSSSKFFAIPTIGWNYKLSAGRVIQPAPNV